MAKPTKSIPYSGLLSWSRLNLRTIIILSGTVILFLAYWLTFTLTIDGDLGGHATSAFYNTFPAVVLALVAHALLIRFVWPQRIWVQLVAQIPLAIAFSLAWYLAILVSLGTRNGWIETGFSIRPFVRIAFVWQMFQGVTFYAVAALASLVICLSDKMRAMNNDAVPAESSASRSEILIKNQKEHEAVPVEEIVCISGAGDYSEVVLVTRTILSTSSLGEFEAALPESRFLRVHRSHLVRMGAIHRVEPAGNGRMSLHLINGQTLLSSRSGTRLLRSISL